MQTHFQSKANTTTNDRWGSLLSMYPVRQLRHPTVRFWSSRPLARLSSCGTGQTLFSVRCASDFCAYCSSL
jgi:hypothetical protein